MQKTSLNYLLTILRIGMALFVATIISLVLISFTVDKINEDFLKPMGISKPDADKKIAASLLGGYLDTYGAVNVKNIALGDRAAIAKDLLTYTKKYANSPAFKNEYIILKANNKPKLGTVQTPAEMQQSILDQFKKSVTDMEASIKKADNNTKPIFEKILVDIRVKYKEAENPNHKTYVNYARNYPQLVKDNESRNSLLLSNWEQQYPNNHLVFIKQHLIRFLEETNNVDFSAALTTRKGVKVFVNTVYETQKSSYWKMAFRSGKEVVEPAREFVQEWLSEIK